MMRIRSIACATILAGTIASPLTAVAFPSVGAKAPVRADRSQTENVYCGRYGCHRRYRYGYYRPGYRYYGGYYRPYGYGGYYGPRVGVGIGGLGIGIF